MKRGYYIVCLSFLIVSCSSISQYITIEVPKPVKSMLPNSIKSLTLMNRSVSDSFQKFDEDTLQKYFYLHEYNLEKTILDSLAVDTTLKVLGDLLYSSGRYDVVIPQDRFFERDLRFYLVPEALDWEEVDNICKQFDTDALLVLERYSNTISSNFIEVDRESDVFYVALINSQYNSVVRIYDPAKKSILKSLMITDTISWGTWGYEPSSEYFFSQLPSIKECLVQTGIKIALDIDMLLSPGWTKEERLYFNLGTNNGLVKNSIAENDWQTIYDFWLPYAESNRKSLKSKAYFNLALASEMLGDIDEALEWIDKSYATEFRIQSERYKRKLIDRQKVVEQFKKFDDSLDN